MRITSYVRLCLVASGLALSTYACGDSAGDDDGSEDGGPSSSSSSSTSSTGGGGSSSSGSSSGDGSSSGSTSTSSSSSSGSTSSSSGSTSSSSGALDDAGPDAEPDAGPADAGADAEPDAGPEPAPAVQFLGRWDFSNPLTPSASWPATRLVVRINGTGLDVTTEQTAGPNAGRTYYDVLVDGAVSGNPLLIETQIHTYSVASGLPAGVHTIEMVRRTEPQQGITKFTAITPTGALLAPPTRPTRRIEVLSESTVNGFGMEAPNPYGSPCNDGPDYVSKFHNARKSFPQQLATALRAELFLTATSYFGLVRHENGSTAAPHFTNVFERTHAFSAGPLWNFNDNQVDVVLVMLGGSDYSSGDDPPGFAAGYRAFATKLRGTYPNAKLMYVIGPQIKNAFPLGYNMRSEIRAIMQNIVATDGANNSFHEFVENANTANEHGCYAHANETMHNAMAATAIPWVRTITGWAD